MNKYILYYYIVISGVTFILMGIDKLKAIKNNWRIKEKTLHLFSFAGGVFGMIFANFIFRHKIRKLEFNMTTALALILHSYLIYRMIG
ncbi:MAG: DUF1294 domain-containing protein [Clostridiales bacterium]|nr:DUF1294 domain-containing protein [Clostridiales bacterium]